MCICGIPSVTLEGTPADWELLAEKVRQLHHSDLDCTWWTSPLLPLCDHFVRASRGDVDRAHWNNLFKLVERYGVDDLNGWLLKFIPYVRRERNESPVHRNPVLERESFETPLSPEQLMQHGPIVGCTSSMLPTGVSRVPVICQYRSGESLPLQFLGGFVGVSQSPDDSSLRPVLDWAISEASGIDALIHQLSQQHGCVAPKAVDARQMVDAFHGWLPGDMWKFYSSIASADFSLSQPNQFGETHCSIIPFDKINSIVDPEVATNELEQSHKRGEISVGAFGEQKGFIWTYGRLRTIAHTRAGDKIQYYVFGKIPNTSAIIALWDGTEINPQSFIPIAKSFTEWLAAMLADAVPAC
jgi:hypothetical protein